MGYKIEVLENNEIIVVTHERVLTLERRAHILHELCNDYKLFKRYKLLIDVRNTKKSMSATEQVIFGRYISSREELKTSSIAILVKEQQTIDQALSQEAASMGMKIKLFNCKDTALAWLNEN